MIKLIASDLDGSLLNDEKQIAEAFWPLEKELRKKGIQFVAASGRPYQSMVADFERIKDDIYFITDNGSYIVYKGKELFSDVLSHQSLERFMQIAKTVENAFPVFCGKDIAYMEPNDPDVLKHALQYYRTYEIVEDLLQVKDPVLKVSICDLSGSEHNSYPKFKHLEDEFKVAVSGVIWLDITGLNANKGTALQRLQKMLNISYEETLVFGDYMNDLEMMQAARYSYAMKNAHPDIIKAANYITAHDNNNNGVVETIKEICLMHPVQ